MDFKQKYLKYKHKYNELNLKIKSLTDSKLNMNGGGNKITLYLFKAEWCPHCISFKSTWDALQNDYQSKVKFIMYDSEKNASEILQYKIEGFPTLILKVNENAIEYVGPRNFDSIKDFIDTYNN